MMLVAFALMGVSINALANVKCSVVALSGVVKFINKFNELKLINLL